jgi:hypothetical protein
MTDFTWLTEDRRVQKTVFGEDIEIIANFREKPTAYAGIVLPPRSVMTRRLLANGSETAVYSPAP